MIKIPEDALFFTAKQIAYAQGYMEGVKKQITNYMKHANTDEEILNYVLKSLHNMHDALENGLNSIKPYISND